MLAAALVMLPLTLLFLLWFYLFRNNTTIPVSPGARPLVGHMHHFFDVTKDTLYKFEQKYFELTDPAKAGPISHMKFFTTSNFSLNTVRHAEALLKSNTNINKSFQYDDFAFWLKDSVLILPDKKWLKRRRILTPAFHFNILDDFAETMKTHGNMIIDLVRENPEQPIVEIIEEVTFHSIVETSFGADLKSAKDSQVFLEAMSRMTLELVQKGFNPINRWEWYYNKTASGKRLLAAMGDLNAEIMKLINDRKRDLELGETKFHKGKRSFLDQLVYEQAENGELTDDEIIGECNTILLAGHATTTGTIAFCLYYLCKHPAVQDRLYAEIMEHLQGRDISSIEVGSLPYLGMVVKETLRLQPPAGLIARRLSEPMEFDNIVLPTGSNVDISIWWMHRDPEHWDDPETFDPERFTVENCKHRHPYAYVPFSAGPRNCIGQRFALLEARLLVAAMVYAFKMHCDQEIGKDLVRDVHDVSVVPGPNLKIKMEPRF